MVVAASIAISAGFGVGLLIRQATPPTTAFALYLTDAQGKLTKLEVEVGSVQVGNGLALDLVNPSFDLASLHGPEDALLIAQGDIPAGVTGPIRVKFTAVHATIDGVRTTIPDPAELVIGALDPEQLPSAALFDIDLESSLPQTAEGLRFEPHAAAVYAVKETLGGDVPDFTQVTPQVPPAPSAADLATLAPDAIATPAGALPSLEAPSPQATVDVLPTEAGVREPVSAAAKTQTGWLVHFDDATTAWAMRDAVEDVGAVFVHGFESLPIAYVLAEPMQIEFLAEHEEGVRHVEPETPLTYLDAESRLAIRQAQVADPVTGLRDAFGNPIDGRGVGIAVVDTGIDTLHPDLGAASNAVVVGNYKVEVSTVVPVPHSDTSGHGTHVAAVIAGQGVQDPTVKGAAPGAKLYGLGVAEGSTIVWAAQAFDWILQNHAKVDPPIRIVTNSWGSGNMHDPDSAITQFTNALVDRGIVVVYAAGNMGDAGNGVKPVTSAQCQIPKPGVICVAGYDDLGTGTRDGRVGAYSSRGALLMPSTWPDISAPGTKVMSARPPAGVSTGVGLNLYYVELSGTSQAAPHVTAVAAMMLQAQPTLTPAAIEAAMKATAYKFTDGGDYDVLGTHYAKGHGLVDAYAAVQLVD